jgi:SnoaL-like domain
VTPSTTASVHTWIDKNELAELVAVLSSAVDRGDRERIASCYAEESYDDHGAFKGSGREFAAYICAPSPSRDGDSQLHHLLGQSIFDIDGDEAWGETFFIFHLAAGGQLLPGFGRYIDYFQRIGSRWQVKYRRVVPDWVGSVGATISPSMASYVRGARDRTDPLYDRRRWHE